MPHELVSLLTLSFLAGLAMVAGALLASFEKIRPQWLKTELRHFIMSFGGGALFSAVALILVPESIKNLELLPIILSFAAGGFVFAALDYGMEKKGSKASNLIAMLSDFLPESIALGASFATGSISAALIALLIGLQNAPEGFNTYREMTNNGQKGKFIISSLLLLSLFGPLSALFGYFYLRETPQLLSIIMLFASGGILYVVFQDIAPQAKLEKKWVPSLGAVLGFLLGLCGYILSHQG